MLPEGSSCSSVPLTAGTGWQGAYRRPQVYRKAWQIPVLRSYAQSYPQLSCAWLQPAASPDQLGKLGLYRVVETEVQLPAGVYMDLPRAVS